MTGFAEKRRAAVDAAMREEVFKTSVEILAEEGLSALTLDRIAKDVGVSRPTLYNYFPDRAGVLIYIEDRVFADLIVQLEAIAATDLPARQRLKTIATTVIDSLANERALLLALFHQELNEQSILEAKAARHEDAISTLSGIIEDGIQTGEFRPLPVHLAADIILSVVSGAIDKLVYAGTAESVNMDIPQMIDILFEGFNKYAK